jgi:hypothetical protein
MMANLTIKSGAWTDPANRVSLVAAGAKDKGEYFAPWIFEDWYEAKGLCSLHQSVVDYFFKNYFVWL